MQWLFRVCILHRPMEPKYEITWLRPRSNIGHWNHEKTHVQVRYCIHSSYRSEYSKKGYTFEQPLSKALLSGLSIKRNSHAFCRHYCRKVCGGLSASLGGIPAS